ncbi:MAG: YfhO family protein [Candidatus Parcubacteria bacterium]|nr:YfhO family protein [Candidatus Parcubacteria bacterium]
MKITKVKALLILFILAHIFFYKIFSFDQTVYPALDNLYSSSPEKSLFSYSIFTYKSLPLWNPYVFSGSPFLGNPTAAMFYPLNILFVLFQVNFAFGYMFVLDSFLIGSFTYLYSRTVKIDQYGSLISGITIMFSSPLITMVYPGHLQNFNTFIWFPLALLFLELMISRIKILFSLLLGITISLMLTAGIPQIAIYEIIALTIYFVLRSLFEIKSFNLALKLIFLLCLSFLAGILLSSVQLLPSIEFFGLSQRGNGLNYAFSSDFSINPRQIISVIFPYFFGSPINGSYWAKGNFWESTLYIGIFPLIFALLAVLFKKSRYVFIFSVLGLFALIYSLGKYGPIFPFFYHHIPGFDSFRVVGRFRYIYVFSLSILAGIGVNFLLNKFKNRIQHFFLKFSILIPIMIIISATFLLYFDTNKTNIYIYEKYVLRNSFAVGINHSILYEQTKKDIIFFLLITLSLYTAITLKRKKIISLNQLKIFIIFAIILDLWLFGSRFINTKNIKDIYRSTPILNKIIEDKSTYRVFDMEGAYIPLLSQYKVENITGVDPLYLKDYRDFLWSIGNHAEMLYESSLQITDISKPIILNLLNVKYVIANKKIIVDGLSEISSSNSTIEYAPKPNSLQYLYKNAELLPRAYIVPNAIVSDKQKVLDLLLDKNFDPKKYIILEKQPAGVPLTNNSSFKQIDMFNPSFNRKSLKINMSDSGFLVLSEIAYPGWKAFDNNKEIEILKADYILRSLYLKPGYHDVEFIYNPDSYRVGMIISSITLLSYAVFFIYLRITKKLI